MLVPVVVIRELEQDVPIQRVKNPNGSYAVNAVCRGSASLEKTPLGTANWEFVIVGHGDEVLQIATTPPRETVMWVLKKQFSR